MQDSPCNPVPRVGRERLDQWLVTHGWCQTRSQARGWILAGLVRRGTEVLDKPGRLIGPEEPLSLLQTPKYVGRGGGKLEGFLSRFEIRVEGLDILDVGASTGGFTDCLLQRGAASATCVDVGYGQLHHRLREDPRVTNLERVHARSLDAAPLPLQQYPLVVMDLSFISVRKVLRPVWNRVAPGGLLIVLLKPQFEASRVEAARSKGVIRDQTVRLRILSEIRQFVAENLGDAKELAAMDCPVPGADGNVEFLVGWARSPGT